MKSCPRCAEMSPPTAFKCRSCGALLVAAPAPPAPAPPPPVVPVAPVAAMPTAQAETAATATAVDDRFFAPATFTPATFSTAPPEKKRVPVGAVVVVLALVIAGIVAFHSLGSSSGSDAKKTPIALAPLSDSDQGLPSLADAVRAQAEGGRARAFSALNQALSASPNGRVDPAMLKQMDPSIAFVDGSESSKGPKEASFTQSDDSMVVAVSTASKEVCAYERQVAGSDPEVVTMGNVSSCRAADAPASGWVPLQNAGTSRGAVLPQN